MLQFINLPLIKKTKRTRIL